MDSHGIRSNVFAFVGVLQTPSSALACHAAGSTLRFVVSSLEPLLIALFALHSHDRLQAWPKAARMSQEEVDALRNEHYEFLQRFHSLVSSTNKPGHVESWEGQRRIAFFVNSMYMQQPGVRARREGFIAELSSSCRLANVFRHDKLVRVAGCWNLKLLSNGNRI